MKKEKIIKGAVTVTTASAMVAAIYAACKALEKEKEKSKNKENESK